MMLKNERNKRIRNYCKINSSLDNKSISGQPVIKNINIWKSKNTADLSFFLNTHQISGNTSRKNKKCFFLTLVDMRF